MLKKVIFIILIIICTVFTFGYFRYNRTVNTANKIPVSADVVIRMNLREIEYTMLKDVVKHPFLYFKSIKNNQHKKAFSLFDEVVFPSNVFFYSNNNVLKNTWVSTTIEIKNKMRLLSFFNQDKFVKKTLEKADYFINKKTVYLINKNQLRIVFNLDEISNIETKLNTILNTNNYLNDENSIVQKLKNSKELIAISTKSKSFLELGVDENEISIIGELSEKNMPFLSYKTSVTNRSVLSFSGKVKKTFLFDYLKKSSKDNFEKLTNVSLDSIQTHWNGDFNVKLASFIYKKDTILTYEYDDDFNKIATTTIQKTIVPDLNISLGGSYIFTYLSSKKAIKNINGEKILVVNPLFKTYADKNSKELFLYSKKAVHANYYKNNQHVNNKFSLFFDVEEYLKTQEDSLIISNDYLTGIKNVKAVITKNNKVDFKVVFKNTPQSFIYKMLK
ncbi:hypothetical protein PG913_11670 [Tenacibaculum pacificus]|uniref:hypothetical protein n=1 Tax=Tenacibaculum pacificus TaxID=3018314 RepID=UPI0022F37D3B|nr:hypothetical protein [Tenacibaculum pacificus]WBX73478.1 hypothetical protein PG913_11670 [Tenacibaculum pacificus]